ncbi:L-threonylcarbamoyladenylate synthase [Rhodanobacter sp. AS-Z3]|uniref:L-threonylcarbamoyladenylate synthase n=1 Tax=Rhodanobacter sp. AS-Z3 TaxID=3031330 RepID=UPI00247B0631|nr:L-threonylcarbamoyladenylate synthase [Rhodanobacter sp. AS-Z3]WEN15702.1 L-threonylcarbamoyladenylate synthase [Rhodanobacter sp. AS-Z3]
MSEPVGGAGERSSAAVAAEVMDAVRALRRGGLIGLPTETVYGLGADASNPQAVARIFAAKERPANHPLIVHLHRPRQMAVWARAVPLAAWELAEACWPGPLTLILPRSSMVADAVTGGLDTVALRVPAHPLALQVLEEFGGGIAAPSANRHKKISPTTAQDVRDELGDKVDVLLDGGPCRVGIESTIVDLSTGTLRVLRPGAIAAAELQQITGLAVDQTIEASLRCPGRMDLHYAPQAMVLPVPLEQVPHELAQQMARGARVGVLSAQRGPAWPGNIPWLPLGTSPAEQAQQLYQRLREADRMRLDVLIVVAPSDDGLGCALRDRLWRAAGRGAAPA